MEITLSIYDASLRSKENIANNELIKFITDNNMKILNVNNNLDSSECSIFIESSASEKINNLKNENKGLKNKNNMCLMNMESYKNEIKDNKTLIDKHNNSISILRIDVNDLIEDKHILNKEIVKLKELNNIQKDKIIVLENENKELKNCVLKLKDENKELKDENKKLKTRILILENKVLMLENDKKMSSYLIALQDFNREDDLESQLSYPFSYVFKKIKRARVDSCHYIHKDFDTDDVKYFKKKFLIEKFNLENDDIKQKFFNKFKTDESFFESLKTYIDTLPKYNDPADEIIQDEIEFFNFN